MSEKPFVKAFKPLLYNFSIENAFERLFRNIQNFIRRKRIAQCIIDKEIVQNIRSYYILRLLRNIAFIIGRKQFGAYLGIQNALKNFIYFTSEFIRFVGYKMLNERFGNGNIHAVHSHMVAVIRGPTERRFA